jgi:hypothetical protein
VMCSDGSTACSTGQCGTALAGQCYFPEPVCPTTVASPVPGVNAWSGLVTAGLLAALGYASLSRAVRSLAR